jgi:alanine-synthesizing transaminase
MIFSTLADAFPEKINRLYSARDVAVARGERILDFISGNVSQHGIVYPEQILNDVLLAAVPQMRVYRPDSIGQPATRQAISNYYEAQGVRLKPEEILVTPGTSISYFYCFKLMANGGDEILCPSPCYPLFETIARLCDVQLTFYPLKEAHDWEIDLDYLESRLTSKTRAIVVISPHNPTGKVASEEQLQSLAEIAQRHHLPIIADEVFNEFLFEFQTLPRPAETRAPLVFTLNGLSKMMALPGMKLGWMGVSGDPTLVKKSMHALEMISASQ